jgi:hypothetical protein
MSKFIFRASIETETAKQDKVIANSRSLADHILAMTDQNRHGARLVVFHRRFVAQTYCEKGADLRVQFTDQVRERLGRSKPHEIDLCFKTSNFIRVGFLICKPSLHGYAQRPNLKQRGVPMGPPTFSRWKRTPA